MSDSAMEKFAQCILDWLSKQGYRYDGRIPINLDYHLNMDEGTHQPCYPGAPISWIQLLAGMTFSITWDGHIPHVKMCFSDDIHKFIYHAECPDTIGLEIQQDQLQIQTPIIIKILNDFMWVFMYKLVRVPPTQHRPPLNSLHGCVCCMLPPDKMSGLVVINLDDILKTRHKRGFDDVEHSTEAFPNKLPA